MAPIVVSGAPAAGKSTVARLLAQRLERGVCVPGDAIRAMIASGRVDMRPGAGRGSRAYGQGAAPGTSASSP